MITPLGQRRLVVVAEAIGGSEDAFAELMTRKARALGMSSHGLYNPSRPAAFAAEPDHGARPHHARRAIQDRFPRYFSLFQTASFQYGGNARSATTIIFSAGSKASTASRPATPAPRAST
jgi:D-alanyl-D-alanine carboxypeptidase